MLAFVIGASTYKQRICALYGRPLAGFSLGRRHSSCSEQFVHFAANQDYLGPGGVSMSSIMEGKAVESRLSATNPNVAFLAARAAIELDRLRQGKATELEAVVELSSLLANSAG